MHNGRLVSVTGTFPLQTGKHLDAYCVVMGIQAIGHTREPREHYPVSIAYRIELRAGKEAILPQTLLREQEQRHWENRGRNCPQRTLR